jgi:hypothetical protein
MGWILLDVAEPGRQDKGSTGTYPLVQNIGILTGWSKLEPREGQFNWSTLDNMINYWVGKGKRIQFRISTDDFPYYGSMYGCPSWVYDAGVPSQTKPADGGIRFPEYTNSIYQEKLKNFLTAYANRYSTLQSLDAVDLRGYGEWGEWHSGYAYDSWDSRVNALRSIINSWCSAWNGQKRLFLSYSHETGYGHITSGLRPQNYEQFLNYSAFDYAANTYSPDVLGFRRDGVAGAVTNYEKQFSDSLYKENRVQISEFCSGYSQYKKSGSSIRQCIDEALELHPNYMVLMGWDKNGGAPDFYKNEQSEIQYALKNMGYRMILDSASYTTAINKGDRLSVSTAWRNSAYGVLPEGYTMQLAVYDSNGKQVLSQVSENFCPLFFSKKYGEAINNISTLDTSILSSGNYTLRYTISDRTGKPILLSLKGQTNDGYYKLGDLIIK